MPIYLTKVTKDICEAFMESLMNSIQHRINPLHVYCRLVEKGIDKPFSLSICRYYEKLVFSWLNWFIVISILIFQAKK